MASRTYNNKDSDIHVTPQLHTAWTTLPACRDTTNHKPSTNNQPPTNDQPTTALLVSKQRSTFCGVAMQEMDSVVLPLYVNRKVPPRFCPWSATVVMDCTSFTSSPNVFTVCQYTRSAGLPAPWPSLFCSTSCVSAQHGGKS